MDCTCSLTSRRQAWAGEVGFSHQRCLQSPATQHCHCELVQPCSHGVRYHTRRAHADACMHGRTDRTGERSGFIYRPHLPTIRQRSCEMPLGASCASEVQPVLRTTQGQQVSSSFISSLLKDTGSHRKIKKCASQAHSTWQRGEAPTPTESLEKGRALFISLQPAP